VGKSVSDFSPVNKNGQGKSQENNRGLSVDSDQHNEQGEFNCSIVELSSKKRIRKKPTCKLSNWV
jgi:hypothetical protein